MQVFGFSYEGYVLDTHILFPHVFLASMSTLSETNERYKQCANEFLQGKLHWIILPSNEDEFNLLILEDFRRFLAEIRIAAIRCRDRGERAFYSECVAQIRVRTFPRDFLVYWNTNKEYFLGWLTLDRDRIQREERRLLRDVLEMYWDLTDHAEIKIKKWENPEHDRDSRAFYGELQRLKEEGLIRPEAHNEDFRLISDCLVYRSYFLELGILYLVTDDGTCFDTVQAIVHCTDEQGKAVHVSGFDSKRPIDIIRAIESAHSKNR